MTQIAEVNSHGLLYDSSYMATFITLIDIISGTMTLKVSPGIDSAIHH